MSRSGLSLDPRGMIATVGVCVAITFPTGAVADEVEELFNALGLAEIIAVMQVEGIEYGDQIATDMLAGRSPDDWQETVRKIYSYERMEGAVLAGLRAELEGTDIAAMTAFFEAEPGRSIVALEVSGRQALLDDAVEEAAKDALADAEGSARLELVRDYIAANDLVETNVVGALNSNYAFYTGLVGGGAFDLTDDQILTEVWASEPEIRANTTAWIESFLLMAYAPLSDDDLEVYVAFSETEAGQELNSALFATFDPLFEDISMALGLGAARFLAGEEL